jgi:hypothetical protein
MKEIILDDELINDYEFGRKIYMTFLIEDMNEFSVKRSLIFSGVF